MSKMDNPYPPRRAQQTEPLPSLDASGEFTAAPHVAPPPRRRGLSRLGMPFAAALAGGVVALGGAAVTGNLGGDEVPVAGTNAPANLPSAGSSGPLTEAITPPTTADNEGEGPETAADVGTDALSVSEIVQRTAPGVVKVEVPGVGLGSGFLVDETGHILTNQHVVDGAQLAEVEFDDGSTREARILGTDPTVDLAVLKVTEIPDSASPVDLGQSARVIVGAPVIALGSPFGLERTATAGIVSAVKRRITSPNRQLIPNVIQTDAAINSGNSGGPLFNRRAEVIGMNSQIASGAGGGNVGIGFAVPIDTLKPIADAIIRTGEPEHAYVGITGTPLTSDTADQLGLGDLRGVIVVEVDGDSGAAAAGLVPTELTGEGENERVTKEGDIIVAADGAPVSDFDELIQAISAKAVGDDITLTVRRGGDERQVTVTLGDRPDDVG